MTDGIGRFAVYILHAISSMFVLGRTPNRLNMSSMAGDASIQSGKKKVWNTVIKVNMQNKQKPFEGNLLQGEFYQIPPINLTD